MQEKLDPVIGIGSGPTRATTLPTDSKLRKQYPVATGFLDYFPDAIVAVSHLSWKANEQHNPGEPIHWCRSKSGNEDDTFMRHVLQRGTIDTDGIRHTAKVAWRALAMLQKELETATKLLEASPAEGVRIYNSRTKNWYRRRWAGMTEHEEDAHIYTRAEAEAILKEDAVDFNGRQNLRILGLHEHPV